MQISVTFKIDGQMHFDYEFIDPAAGHWDLELMAMAGPGNRSPGGGSERSDSSQVAADWALNGPVTSKVSPGLRWELK
jgi:hypothetical protein